MLVIDSDAHWPRTLKNMRYGVATARRAWITSAVANTRPWPEWTSCASARAADQPSKPGGAIFLQARQCAAAAAARRASSCRPELHAVAALDRLDRARLLSPESATSSAVARRYRRHLRKEEAHHRGCEREHDQRPEPVEEHGARLDLGQAVESGAPAPAGRRCPAWCRAGDRARGPRASARHHQRREM